MTSALADKVILVAGASSGMGRAIAVSAARQGSTVLAVGRNTQALQLLEEESLRSGLTLSAHTADATDAMTLESVVKHANTRFGRLDAVVNSVGSNIRARSLSEVDEAGWREVLHSNLDAAFALTRAALPVFRRQHDGLIIHISSSAVKKPDMSGVSYQAAKAGVVGLAHATMEEERKNGIRVSVLIPGLTDTPLVKKRPVPVPDAVLAQALHPEDVAAICVALLALPARAYVPEVCLFPSNL